MTDGDGSRSPAEEKVTHGELRIDGARIERLRREHLGCLLSRALATFETDVLEGFRARGIAVLERSDLPVLRNLDLEGTRITEIAERAGLSKQTVGPMVRELARKGIVRVDPDPADRRAKLVRLTERGREGLLVALEVIEEAVRRYTERLGEKRMIELRSALTELVEAFEGREVDRRGDGRGAGGRRLPPEVGRRGGRVRRIGSWERRER